MSKACGGCSMEELVEKGRVCVTGAGGYVASWLVNLLLSKGYMVHGTVKDPCDSKNSHLKKLGNSSENLKLFKADLLDFEGLCAAIVGCTGVFHVACPVPLYKVPNPEVEMNEPAIKGTRNVLNACVKAKVKRVVVVSSVGAIMVNPKWAKDKVLDEDCWSDMDFCNSIGNYYWLAKTRAEREAVEFGKTSEVDIVTVCPSVVIGPRLQPSINTSSLVLLALVTDGIEEVEDLDHPLVDVRDVAEALLLVYEKPEAKGRYICTSSYTKRMRALADKLRTMYPNYTCTRKFIDVERGTNPISSEKLQKLGWKCRSLEETIIDSVKDFEDSGILIPFKNKQIKAVSDQ